MGAAIGNTSTLKKEPFFGKFLQKHTPNRGCNGLKSINLALRQMERSGKRLIQKQSTRDRFQQRRVFVDKILHFFLTNFSQKEFLMLNK